MSGEVFWSSSPKRGEIPYWDGTGPAIIKAASGSNAVLQWVGGLPLWVVNPTFNDIIAGNITGAQAKFTNLNVSGWTYLGSLLVPTNQAAGDLTATRLILPDQTLVTPGLGVSGRINVLQQTSGFPGITVRLDSVANTPAMLVQGFATIPRIDGMRSSGSLGAPGAVADNNELLVINGTGLYNATDPSAIQASLRFAAIGAWSGASRAAQTIISCTPVGSTALADYHWFKASGFHTIGWIGAGISDLLTPVDITPGVIASANRIYPGNAADWFIAMNLPNLPTLNFDAGGDYYQYDRAGDRHRQFVASVEILRAGATAIEHKSYGVRATNSAGTAAQVVAPATVVSVNFNAESYDTGAMHSTAVNTNRLIAPVAGRYHVSGGVFWSLEPLSTTTLLLCRLSKNGVPIPGARNFFGPISSIGTNGQGQNVSSDVDLAAGEYVSLEVFFDAGAANRSLVAPECALSMHYIGGLP